VAQLRGVEEVAHDAVRPVRKLDAVHFPLVSLDLVNVGARIDEVFRTVRIAGIQRTAEYGDDFGRDRLGPQDADCFVERTADDRAYVAERDLLGDRIHVSDAEVGIHDVDAERHLLDELDEGPFAYAEDAVWRMRTDWVLPTVVHDECSSGIALSLALVPGREPEGFIRVSNGRCKLRWYARCKRWAGSRPAERIGRPESLGTTRREAGLTALSSCQPVVKRMVSAVATLVRSAPLPEEAQAAECVGRVEERVPAARAACARGREMLA